MKNQTSGFAAFAGTCIDDLSLLILNNIPELILLVDTDLNIVFSNEAAIREIRRKLKKEVKPGTPLLSLLAPDKHPTLLSLVNDVWDGTTRILEASQETSFPGEEVYEHSLIPARDSAGKITAILIRSVNITERKNAERTVQEAEERWQFAFEASNQAAWDWNMETNQVIYSGSYNKLYGFTEGDLKNDLCEWMNRIHPDDRPRIEQAIDQHVRTDDPFYETTYRIQLKNGEYKWIMARGKLLEKDSQGRPLRMIGTHTDLTQTLRDKEEIRMMNERFDYAARASSQALWEWDAKTGEAFISQSFTEMFGWEADENRHFDQWHQYVHPDDRETTINPYYQTLHETSETFWQGTYRFLKADGSYAIVSDKAYILRDETKRVKKVIGATQDITALKKTEEELYKSNERFAIMMKATHDMLWDWDIEADHIYRSKEGLKCVYGVEDDSTFRTLQQWLQRLHPDDHLKVQQIIENMQQAAHQSTFELEYRFLQDNGETAYIYDRGILLKDKNGKPVRIIGATQNISERKRLEAELLNHELETKKRINQASVDSQEQERSEIGRELHDNVNQLLTTTKLYLELALHNTDMMEELVKKSSFNLSNAINEIRQLSRSLMDPTIGDLGIIESVRDLAENLNLTGKVQVILEIDETIESKLDKKQKLTIFRILQESLNNVVRHAFATFVVIRIKEQDGRLMLKISDDGVGFSSSSIKKGAGLNNITNRVYLINGKFSIKSEPGYGCQIKINFPIKNPSQFNNNGKDYDPHC